MKGRRTKKSARKRLANFGVGRQFKFHGAFTEKAAAVAKEQSIPGAFIKTMWFKSGPRWVVVTKNPAARVLKNARKLCNARIPRAGRCTRLKNHSGPHLPQGATPKSRLPKKWGGKHRNMTTTWGKSGVDPKRDTEALKKAVDELYPGKQIKDLTRDEFSKAAGLAWKRLHGKKENPVQKVPGGWRAVVRGRLGPVLPSRRDAEIYAESLRNPPRRNAIFTPEVAREFARRIGLRQEREDRLKAMQKLTLPELRRQVGETTSEELRRELGDNWVVARRTKRILERYGADVRTYTPQQYEAAERRILLRRWERSNPHRRRGTRRNYADSGELYEQFHGREADGVTDIEVPEPVDYGNHPELGQLGRLVSLTVGSGYTWDTNGNKPKLVKDTDGAWSKKIQWSNAEAPDLAAEPGGRQLYVVGGVQDLSDVIRSLPVEPHKDMIDLGFAYQVEYFTQKKFDNFQPVTYYHDLGEETGDVPRLVYDQVNKRIHFVGGAYEVKPEGIVN